VPTLLSFGARGVGRATARLLAAQGWNVAAVARTEATAASLAEELPDALTLPGDAARAEDVERAFEATRARFGDVDLVLVAITPGRAARSGSMGEIADLAPDAFAPYLDDLLPATFGVLRVAARVLREQGHGTIVQATGGAARRGRPGIGLWSAAAQATKALAQSAALELREHGVHVALLVIDAGIERPGRESPAPGLYTRDEDVAEAVAFLARQPPTAWTHELVITPAGDRFTP